MVPLHLIRVFAGIKSKGLFEEEYEQGQHQKGHHPGQSEEEFGSLRRQ